jgi:mono/diheme cytochrome c family protein
VPWPAPPSTLAATARGSEIARGEHLARTLCSACHVIAANQQFPPILIQKTPSFSEIANRPDTSVQSLERFISHTRWDEQSIPMTMPDQMLDSPDIKAVAHYILSLRKR